MFKTRKLKERIKFLENQITGATWEWNKEKEQYDSETKKRILTMKMDWVDEGLDIKKIKSIHRPIYNLTEDEAKEIANGLQEKYNTLKIPVTTGYHWDDREECYRIDLKYIGGKEND